MEQHFCQDGYRMNHTQPEQAVIVGATGSVGTAVVARLVAKGLRVVAVARSRDNLERLVATSPNITACVADIAEDGAIDAIRAKLDGRVRLALFAAGLPVRGSVDTIELGALAIGANIKLGGVVRLLRAVREKLGPGSRFVAIAGSLGLEPRPHEAGPGAINAGLLNLMRQISLLYGPQGITTHTLSPGPADTPRLRRIIATVADEQGRSFDEVWQSYLDQNSLRRLAKIDEIAWTVEMLLEPQADVMHGSVLYLDAGGHHGIW
jgi:NAD(P)-dependent dehydrogenase (short-subunit alcohol dehydrogenase family)